MHQNQVKEYKSKGFFSPIKIMSSSETDLFRKRFETYEEINGGWYELSKGQKLYLLQTWVAELATKPKVLDCVEAILGNNIMVWGTSLFVKEPYDETFVSWHQDSTYWGLSKLDVVTAWLALSPATLESGCMKMIPGSHKWEQMNHFDSFDAKNLLTRGQKLLGEIDESEALPIELAPGEMSLHHIRTTHSSGMNRSPERRIGIAVRYIAPHVRQINSENDSAWLVRGIDNFHNFIHETPPDRDMTPSALAEHKRITKLRQGVLYREKKLDLSKNSA